MAINILIGIGGTGAKIVESALYLLSAGVGPPGRVIICLVDQDNANGNVRRTESLLELLSNLKEDFRPGHPNRIDWLSLEKEGGTSLFSISVEPFFETSAHWRPAPDNLPTLRHVLKHQELPDDEKDLFNLLFRDENARPSEAEQTMNLAEGYRGRAHVGAAALVSAVNHDQPEFLSRITELMQASNTGEDIRIFMAGSLFGGTGAAGFPTIARMLHQMRAPENNREIKGDKVRIGGALMLPYFSFGKPEDANANVITTPQLLPQARVAVEFYQSLLKQEGVFDRLYVSGWDKMFELGYHEAGKELQRNPALLPELIGAMSAMDFFTLPMDEVAADKPQVAARRDPASFGWADIPANPALKKTLYNQLGGTLRFALWWRYRIEPAIDVRGPFGGIKPWLKRLAGDTDWQVETPEVRIRLKDYSESLLKWASAMRLFSGGTINDFALWNSESLWAQSKKQSPTDPITFHLDRSEEDSFGDLNAILRPSDDNAPPVDATVVFSDLNERIDTGESLGLGRLVAAVHRATRPFRNEA